MGGGGGVSPGLFRVGLEFVSGKFQILGLFKGLLKSCFVFWVGLGFRVGLVCIYIVHFGVYFGLRSRKAENSREADR